MRLAPVKILLLLVASGICGTAGPIRYVFEFAPTGVSGPASFSYEAGSATLPGTMLSDVQASMGLIFPLVASRNATGEWSFYWMGSPSFTFQFTALTPVGFPNSPGIYMDVPARITSNVMFVVTTVEGTVDIRIEESPDGITLLEPVDLPCRRWCCGPGGRGGFASLRTERLLIPSRVGGCSVSR